MRPILFCFALLAPFFLLAQDNLLMNGGFEDENICTEYNQNCAPEGWISTSLFSDYYFDDAPNAYEGQHFVGLALAANQRLSGRNFLRTRLMCGLRKDAQYRLEFYIRSQHQVFDSIGVYLSATDFLFQRDKLRQSKPQFLLKDIAPLSPSKTWQKVSLVYTASGTENFLSIGDFKKEGHALAGRPDLGKEFYFFLDRISLTPLNPREHLSPMADSLRSEEYHFDARHKLLDRMIYVLTKNPPPVPPAPKTIVQRVDTLVIPDVLFATDSYVLGAEAKSLLADFAKGSGDYKIDSLVVEGHTDNQGSATHNQKLSQNRAASVAGYLNASLRTPAVTRGWGSEKPVADNRTVQGRQQNRRVEIYLYVHD